MVNGVATDVAAGPTMSGLCALALSFVWGPGRDCDGYHVTDHDSGAGTNLGVTEATWAAAVARGIVTGALKDAQPWQCGRVLKRMFWDVCRCDDLGPGIGLVVFNMAMVSGPREASLILQRVVGADEDGFIGEKTVAAAKAMDACDVLKLLTTRDEEFFAGLVSAKWFLKGWDARAEACYAAGIAQLPDPLTPVHRPAVA